MVPLSSDLRGGILCSHIKTVQKTGNNNCGDTKEKQHIYQHCNELPSASLSFGEAKNSRPSLSQQVELLHKLSLHLQNKGFMQCPTSNGNPFFMNFCSPPRPDISSWSKAFGSLCFLCASQMAPRGYHEKPARNFRIYEARIRSYKLNRHISNCLV